MAHITEKLLIIRPPPARLCKFANSLQGYVWQHILLHSWTAVSSRRLYGVLTVATERREERRGDDVLAGARGERAMICSKPAASSVTRPSLLTTAQGKKLVTKIKLTAAQFIGSNQG